MDKMPEGLITIQKDAETKQLVKCNEYSAHYGMVLSEHDIAKLEDDRFKALTRTQRVEFGGGILPSLIYAFCDSPYISRKNYADILSELQDLFYEAKNRCCSLVNDEELIGFMKKNFNEKAQGSVVLLSDAVDDMCLKSVQSGKSAADLCDVEDFSYINHNSEAEGMENQNDG